MSLIGHFGSFLGAEVSGREASSCHWICCLSKTSVVELWRGGTAFISPVTRSCADATTINSNEPGACVRVRASPRRVQRSACVRKRAVCKSVFAHAQYENLQTARTRTGSVQNARHNATCACRYTYVCSVYKTMNVCVYTNAGYSGVLLSQPATSTLPKLLS